MQRVRRGSVSVEGSVVGAIEHGLLVYLGVGRDDDDAAAALIADKIAHLRIFEDDRGRMQHDVIEAKGAVLVVPQFTLYGDVRKGRRPAFDQAMEPVGAERLYLSVAALLRGHGLTVATGAFRAHMLVEGVNDGPINILIDSARTF